MFLLIINKKVLLTVQPVDKFNPLKYYNGKGVTYPWWL